jgi:hypothetical protein
VTARLAGVADAVADSLHARELDKARTLFDEATGGDQGLVEELVRQLAATVVLPPGLVVWGFGIDIWANPHRFDYAWRCGGCRWTASNYVTDQAARAAAERHVVEDHARRPLTVVSYLDEAYWQAVAEHEQR